MAIYRNIELDLIKNEIRGERLEKIVIKNRIEDVPNQLRKKTNPELEDFLVKLKCKKFMPGWKGFGVCITEDGKILEIDWWKKEVVKEGNEELLKEIARAEIIPESEWLPEYADIPVKIIDKIKEVV